MTLATRDDATTVTRPLLTVSVLGLAWAAAATVFLALRLAVIWQAPVGGSELTHLSGAWNASLGLDDERFIPTLFQGLTAWLFEFTSSPVLPRVLAFLATATVPAAVYLLRTRLGEVGALFALLVLAFDPVSIWLGSAATAAAFDVAVSLWLLVAIAGPALPRYAWPVLAFLVASSGPLPLVLAVAAFGLALARGLIPALRDALPVGVAVVVAVGFATLGYGRGVEGLVIPPIAAFGTMFTEPSSTATVADLVVLYAWPLVLGGGVAGIQAVARFRGLPRSFVAPGGLTLVLGAWFGLALALVLATLTEETEIPVVAVTVPAALLLGPALAGAIAAIAAVRQPLAWLALALALFILVLIVAIAADWARLERVGPANEVARVLVYAGALLMLGAGLLWLRTPPALFLVPILAFSALPLFAGSFAIATSASSEPLPSPLVGDGSRALRAVALEAVARDDGPIALHLDLAPGLAWALRDSGPVTVTTDVPDGAAVVIWPASRPAPDGYVPVPGVWSLRQRTTPPTAGLLDVAHWFVERHSVGPMPEPVAVYTRAVP